MAFLFEVGGELYTNDERNPSLEHLLECVTPPKRIPTSYFLIDEPGFPTSFRLTWDSITFKGSTVILEGDLHLAGPHGRGYLVYNPERKCGTLWRFS